MSIELPCPSPPPSHPNLRPFLPLPTALRTPRIPQPRLFYFFLYFFFLIFRANFFHFSSLAFLCFLRSSFDSYLVSVSLPSNLCLFFSFFFFLEGGGGVINRQRQAQCGSRATPLKAHYLATPLSFCLSVPLSRLSPFLAIELVFVLMHFI